MPTRRTAILASLLALTGCKSSPSSSSSPAPDSGPVAAGPALPVAPIGHSGRWLTDATGRVLLVHGVNVVNKNPPYTPAASGFSDDDAQWLADNGFRVVRVGILATGLMPTPGAVDTTYVQQVAATVSTLASHQIYSLIDLHQDGWGPVTGSDGFPGWMTLTGDAFNQSDAGFPLYYENNPALQQAFQSFWDDDVGPDDAGLQEDYATMFSAVAAQLSSQPYVLGYDLFNEPWPGTTWNDCLNDPNGCPTLDQNELGPAYAKATAAIRDAGDQHLILGEPFVLFNFGTATTSVPVPGGDPNAGMSFHVYPIVTTAAPDVIDAAIGWSQGTGGALLNTEWGATDDTAVLTSISTELDSALVPWIFWSFCCELVSTFGDPLDDADIVQNAANILVQPYPLAVAGTPQALTIDPVGETLSFTWSTARPAGGTFAPGTVTTFEVPARSYPGGYTTTVTGGTVTSAACAPLLTVEASAGATSVTVAIQPGGSCP